MNSMTNVMLLIVFHQLCLLYIVSIEASSISGVFNSKARKSSNCDTWDCSQTARFKGDSNFTCIIEGEKEWNQRRKHFKLLEEHKFPILPWRPHPPLITEVHLNTSDTHLALNVKFRLPYDEHFDTQAVLLTFASVDEKSVQDRQYYKRPRYRIFNFTKYRTSLDRKQQREIGYRCLYDLDTNGIRRVYTLTLTTLPYNQDQRCASLKHVITVTHSINEDWKSIISLSLYPTSKDIRVVFEGAPEDASVFHYKIVLYLKQGKWINEKSITGTNYTHTFENLETGVYFVKVIPESATCDYCKESESYKIQIFEQNAYTDKIGETHEENKTTGEIWLYIVIGVVLAGLLLTSIFGIKYCSRRNGQNHRSDSENHRPDSEMEGVCIYLMPTCNGVKHNQVIEEIASYIGNVTARINSYFLLNQQNEVQETDNLINDPSVAMNPNVKIVFLCDMCTSIDFQNIEDFVNSESDILFSFKSSIERTIPETLSNMKKHCIEESERFIQNLDILLRRNAQQCSPSDESKNRLLQICQDVCDQNMEEQMLQILNSNAVTGLPHTNNCPIHG